MIFNNQLWQNQEQVEKTQVRDARLTRQLDSGQERSIGRTGWMQEARHQEMEPARVVGSLCSLLPFRAGCK